MNDQVVTHLDFKLDLNAMKVRFPQNKRLHALKVVNDLQKIHIMTHISLEETLDFLSHYCTIISLKQLFLQELYSLLHHLFNHKCLYLHFVIKQDLK